MGKEKPVFSSFMMDLTKMAHSVTQAWHKEYSDQIWSKSVGKYGL
jgi:hypothetical protein